MYQGWISLNRRILDHWLWGNKPFSPGQAWIDLLLLANHKDEKTLFNGKNITVKRGSRITSIRILADRWGWSRAKVTRFLDVLQNEKMIAKKSDTKKTVITIANYGNYQDLQDTRKPQKSRTKATTVTQKSTNNNNNNDNNENNIGGCAAGPLPGNDERAKLIAELRR